MTATPNKSPLTSVIPTPSLCIEHALTADMDDGQPLPPLIGRRRRVARGAAHRWLYDVASSVSFPFRFSRHQLAHGAGRSNTSAVRKDQGNGYAQI
jgi:hypothetical protein